MDERQNTQNYQLQAPNQDFEPLLSSTYIWTFIWYLVSQLRLKFKSLLQHLKRRIIEDKKM